MEAGERLSSLLEAVRLLSRGEQMLICVPDVPLVASAFLSLTPTASFRIDQLQARTAKEAVSKLRREVAEQSTRKLLVVEWPGEIPHWGKRESDRVTFLASLIQETARRGIKSVTVLPRSAFSDEAVGTLKDLPALFVLVERFGGNMCCQFLTARGIYSPDFFLPRLVNLNDPALRLENPVLPIPVDAANQSSTGTATVKDLLQEPYREMFESVQDGMVIFDLAGSHRNLNPRAIELLGYSPAEFPGLPLSSLVGRSDYRKALRTLASLKRGIATSGEIHLRKKNGRLIRALYSASVIRESLSVAVFRELQDRARKRNDSELHEDRLRALAGSSPLPQAIFGSRKLVYANAPFTQLFPSADPSKGGISLREFFGKQNADWLAELSRATARESGGGDVANGDVELQIHDGSRRDFSVHAVQTMWDAKESWFITLTDVTDRNSAVRTLRSSEEFYRTVFERQTGQVALLQDGVFTMMNPACMALFGFSSAEEATGKEITSLIVSRERKTIIAGILARGRSRDEVRFLTFTTARREGEHRLIRMSYRDVSIGGKDSLLCHFADVTEQLALEKEGRRAARERSILEHLSHEFHRSLGSNEVLEDVLRSSMKWLECEQGGIFTFNADGSILELLHVEALAGQLTETLAVQSTTEGLTGLAVKSAEPLLLDVQNYPAYLPYKSLFAGEGIRTVVILPLQAANAVNAVMMLCSTAEASAPAKDKRLLENICRHAGRALANALQFSGVQEAARKHQTIIASIPDIVYETGPSGTVTYVSSQVERMLGYKPEEVLRDPDLWRSLLHPDDRPEYSRRITDRLRGVEESEIVYRMLPKGKAAYRWMRDAVRYHKDESGGFAAITGIVSDITSRVEAEMALATAGGFHADVLQSVQEGVVVYDKDLCYREWNRAMELITGHGREAVLGRSALEGFPEFRLSDFTDLLHRALAGTPVSTEDVQYMRPGSDEPSMLWCRFSPLRNSDGTIAGVVGTVTDVTHRKSLERELRESEETLRNVIDTMGDALMISDLQGKVWEVNREFSALTGFARGDVIGATFPYPWLVEEEMPRYVVWLGALREQKFLRDFDMTWKQATGRTVAISLNTTLLRNALGEPVAMLNLARNISERRHLADALSAKSRQIEMLNRIISQANSTMEFPRIFDLIAEEVLALTTYDHMSVRLLTPDGEHLVVHGGAGTSAGMPGAGAVLDLKSSVSALAVARRESVTISDMQAPIPKVDDPVLTASGLRSVISLPIMFDENVLGVFELYWAAKGASSGEELEYLQPIADQIGALIDRTQLFQRVSDDSAYIHNLLDSIESVVYTVDQTSTVREVNKAWRDFAVLQGTPGLIEQSAVIGRPLEDVVAYEPLKVELRQIMPKLFDGTMREFSREFELTAGEQAKRSYQLGVTPMAVTGQVTGLVFTYTDITESKRAEAEIKRRNEELMTLNEVASSINKSLNLEEVLSIATERVSALVRSDMVLCYLLDEHGEAATLAAHRGIDSARAHLLQRLPVPESGVASGSVQGSFTLVTEEGGIDAPLSEASRAFLRNSGARSLLVCPLESKDRTLGALVVGFVEPRWSTEQEHRLLRLVANQLGSALENVQLYSEVQAQVRRVTLLYEIGKGLTGALDKKTILTVVHDHLKNSLGFDTFAYFEWSTKTRTARVLFELPAGDGIDPHDPAINATGDGAPFIGVSAKGESLLAVPVRQKVGVMGIIALIARNADAFSVSQLRLLESIGNLTEIAIDRASLYEDTVAKSEEIELRNKELDDFTYVVSHDLKEPLITIEGYSKIVMNDYQDKFDEEGRSFLNSVVQSSQRMKSLIDDLLTLSRIGRVSEMQESLSLKRVISEVLRDLEFRLKETKATVEIPPDLPAVRYNGTQLKMVFRNLIANAVKFNRSVQPSIVIGVAEGEKEYTVSVTDNGIGIERDHYDKIFVIFQRLHRTDEFRGTGAGLTIVKKIVENHHGRIWLESVVGQGSTFYFTIQR